MHRKTGYTGNRSAGRGHPVALLLVVALVSAAGAVGSDAVDSDAPPERETALATLARDPSAIASGRDTYNNYCQACHGSEDLTIDSPSNLFDGKWVRDGSPAGIERTVREGITEKGMPAWGEMISNSEIDDVIAFILSFQTQRQTTDD